MLSLKDLFAIRPKPYRIPLWGIGGNNSMTFYSRKLLSTKQNYDIVNKELLAIIVALNYWKTYAKGAIQLDIYTDYKNLVDFTTTKKLQRRCDYIESKEVFDYNILKINEDETLFVNYREIITTMRIMRNKEE